MTILQFARGVLAATGSKSRIEFQPLPVDDPKVRQPDISKAKRLLGWEPKVGLEEGLSRTLSYFRARVVAGAKPVDKT
jgi:dTDP-glucose 4,6-dehydratase